MESGKCVVPENYRNGARITLQGSCGDLNAKYEQTKMYSTKHIASGKCWHPKGGSRRPTWATEVVLYSGCDKRRLIFRFEVGE